MKRNNFEVLYKDLAVVTTYLDRTGKRFIVSAIGKEKAVINVNLSKKEVAMLQALSCMSLQAQ